MGVLQLYQWYIEKGTFYQGVEMDPSGRTPKRYWKWSSSIKKLIYCFQIIFIGFKLNF